MFKKLRWEQIQEETKTGHVSYRTPVPGGWLVAVWAPRQDGAAGSPSGGLTFMADPQHDWVVDTFERT
ncbi:hypothetical protein [Sorangium sp. So ce233]|uniref:hypothetical protein n=1 Tax=Sorangium sp. So ce233 TaxID=3133290 RepID=UPI003F5D856C